MQIYCNFPGIPKSIKTTLYKLSYFDIIIIIMKKFSDSSNRFRCEKKKKNPIH